MEADVGVAGRLLISELMDEGEAVSGSIESREEKSVRWLEKLKILEKRSYTLTSAILRLLRRAWCSHRELQRRLGTYLFAIGECWLGRCKRNHVICQSIRCRDWGTQQSNSDWQGSGLIVTPHSERWQLPCTKSSSLSFKRPARCDWVGHHTAASASTIAWCSVIEVHAPR